MHPTSAERARESTALHVVEALRLGEGVTDADLAAARESLQGPLRNVYQAVRPDHAAGYNLQAMLYNYLQHKLRLFDHYEYVGLNTVFDNTGTFVSLELDGEDEFPRVMDLAGWRGAKQKQGTAPSYGCVTAQRRYSTAKRFWYRSRFISATYCCSQTNPLQIPYISSMKQQKQGETRLEFAAKIGRFVVHWWYESVLPVKDSPRYNPHGLGKPGRELNEVCLVGLVPMKSGTTGHTCVLAFRKQLGGVTRPRAMRRPSFLPHSPLLGTSTDERIAEGLSLSRTHRHPLPERNA